MTSPAAANFCLQVADEVAATDLPGAEEFAAWTAAALSMASQAEADGCITRGCITLRVVAAQESAALNGNYRAKSGPTNILAFPAGPALLPATEVEPELGDLVLCLDVARREADEQGKALHRHLAHLTVHGTLHLLGYDHIDAAEAGQMEGLERRILTSMGIADPYAAAGEDSEDSSQNGNN